MAAVLCNYLSALLGECSACLSYPCQECCKCTSRMICSPFTPYLIVTLSFNITLMVWGYEVFKRGAIFCDKAWWVLFNALLGFCHIIGAVYLVYRIQRDRVKMDAAEEQNNNDATDPENNGSHTNSSVVPAQMEHRQTTNVITNKSIVNSNEGEKNDLKSPRTPSSRAAIYQKAKGKLRSPSPSPSTRPTIKTTNENNDYVLMKEKNSVENKTSKNKHRNQAFFPDWDNEIPSSPQAADAKIESVASLLAGLPDAPDDGPANSPQRLGRVLCFDSGVAFYFFLMVLWVLWQSVGVMCAMSLARNINYNEDDHCDNIQRWIVLSTMCGFLYIILVFFAFGCSLLCLR